MKRFFDGVKVAAMTSLLFASLVGRWFQEVAGAIFYGLIRWLFKSSRR